jgi:rubrerythrin
MDLTRAARLMWWVVIPLLVAAARSVRAEEGGTFAAMQAAYSMEMNAQTRYLAFATRADFEAQPTIACLFRAVACAESVHAANHARAIEQLQGTPKYSPAGFVVRETGENLKTAIATELQERSFIYPRFAAYARSECLYDALASYNYAKGAEATHERMFRMALAKMEIDTQVDRGIILASFTPSVPVIGQQWSTRCFVCLGDGSLFTQPLKRCPNCGTGAGLIVEHSCER